MGAAARVSPWCTWYEAFRRLRTANVAIRFASMSDARYLSRGYSAELTGPWGRVE